MEQPTRPQNALKLKARFLYKKTAPASTPLPSIWKEALKVERLQAAGSTETVKQKTSSP